MGKVECCSLPGYLFTFPSRDHEPPHVHIRRFGEWEIRVDLRQTTTKHLSWTPKWPKTYRGPSRTIRMKIAKLIVENRTQLIEEWEIKVCRS